MEKLENVKSDRQQQKSPLSFIKKLFFSAIALVLLLLKRWRSLAYVLITVLGSSVLCYTAYK
jgi:hypothetical protein